jgi:hypothetical protein
MNVSAKMTHRFKVGDRVRLRLGARLVAGRVVEDLGQIGVARQQLVRVEVSLDTAQVHEFEVSAGVLVPVPRRRAAARAATLR